MFLASDPKGHISRSGYIFGPLDVVFEIVYENACFWRKNHSLGGAGLVPLGAHQNSVQVGGVNASRSSGRGPFGPTITFFNFGGQTALFHNASIFVIVWSLSQPICSYGTWLQSGLAPGDMNFYSFHWIGSWPQVTWSQNNIGGYLFLMIFVRTRAKMCMQIQVHSGIWETFFVNIKFHIRVSLGLDRLNLLHTLSVWLPA